MDIKRTNNNKKIMIIDDDIDITSQIYFQHF
jgi:hypothetical protein